MIYHVWANYSGYSVSEEYTETKQKVFKWMRQMLRRSVHSVSMEVMEDNCGYGVTL